MKIIAYKVLGNNVIVVATEGAIKDWAAYIAAIIGYDTDEEEDINYAATHGTKLNPEIAIAIFPEFDIDKYRR